MAGFAYLTVKPVLKRLDRCFGGETLVGLLNRGFAHKMKGEKDEAIRDLERVLELSEDEDLRNDVEEQLRELRGQ
jgi:hypothetical protein